jgi:hypothetical protein
MITNYTGVIKYQNLWILFATNNIVVLFNLKQLKYGFNLYVRIIIFNNWYFILKINQK